MTSSDSPPTPVRPNRRRIVVGVLSIVSGLVAVALLTANRDRIRMRDEERSCNRGNAETCLQLAELYASGTQVQADPHRAAGLLARAEELLTAQCTGGSASSCFQLGEVLSRQNGAQGKIVDAFGRGCDAGLSKSCLRAAAYCSVKDSDKHHALLVKACLAGEDQTCVNTAKALPEDSREAAKLLGAACKRGHTAACDNLSNRPNEPNEEKAPEPRHDDL